MDVSGEATLMYRCPGTNRGPNGQTYDWTPAASEAAVDMLLRSGWSTSLTEALSVLELKETASGAPSPTTPAVPTTPEERALAAEASLRVAAERSLAANQDLAAAETASVEADKALRETTSTATDATAVLDAAAEKEKEAAAQKAQATGRALNAGKALAACKLRAAAAEKTLTEAAANQLASDNLVAEAKEKALKAAAAADKALAAAVTTEKNPKKGKTEALKAEDDPIGATFDDVKDALTRLREGVDAKAVTTLLKKFGVSKAPDLKENQYADVIAAAEEALRDEE